MAHLADPRVWLAGLISAAANGAASALMLYAVAPEASMATILKATGVSMALAVANHLRRSPLPGVETQ